MKIITIGDIHGRDNWKLINPDDYDKVIFIGDYVDSYDIEPVKQLENLKEIIQFKLENYDKVELLVGNHDIQYIYNTFHFKCSGYQFKMSLEFNSLFNKNLDLFKMAFKDNDFIWSHAGICEYMYPEEITDEYIELLNENLHSSMKARNDLMRVGYKRGGFHTCGSMIWADASELKKYAIKDFKQVVGHTPHDSIGFFHSKERNASLFFTDVLEKTNEFLVIIDGDITLLSL